MPDNAEERKSTAGIVTPNASKDAEWRREVGGLFADTGASAGAVAMEMSRVSIGLCIGI